jgi:hypothetical protein
MFNDGAGIQGWLGHLGQRYSLRVGDPLALGYFARAGGDRHLQYVGSFSSHYGSPAPQHLPERHPRIGPCLTSAL